MIPYGRQDVTEADIQAVTDVLRSDFLTQGPVVPRFEQAVAGRVGGRHAVAVNSATSALHVACLAMEVGPGDRVWTVPNTFVASANCALYTGAEVAFVDIDPETWNLDVAALRRRLDEARTAGQLPKVVIPVHFAGQPTDQEEIHELSGEYGFRIIEDASHAIGAGRNGEAVGSCRWSDITVFSFHPVKIITTGEGGMALTNDDDLAERMRLLRSHGITRGPSLLRGGRDAYQEETPPGAWYYEQQLLGYNYRMTDVAAVLGLSQLDRLDCYVERRNELAARYDAALRDLPLRLPTVLPENRSAFHLYVVQVRGESPVRLRRTVFDGLRSRGIGANVHYLPVHLQPYYRDLGFEPGLCPVAEAHGDSALTLPLFGSMTEKDQDTVIEALRCTLGGAS